MAMSSVLRDATVAEEAAIAVMFHNAFIPVWNHNWFVNADVRPPPITLLDVPTLSRTASTRLLFYTALIASTRLSNGVIRVIAVPSSDPADADDIVACCMWTRPGAPLSSSLSTHIKSGFLRFMWQVGWTGFQRIALAFEGTIERLQKACWAGRSSEAGKVLSAKDVAYLQMVAVREDARGRGLAGDLVKDGLSMFGGGSPVMLDATEEGPKRLYEHLGFKVVGQGWVGEGECDGNGLTSGAEKPGGPIFLMLFDGRKEVTYLQPPRGGS